MAGKYCKMTPAITSFLFFLSLSQPAFSQPTISVNPMNIDFGTICPERSPTSVVTISNVGAEELLISDMVTVPMPGDVVIFFKVNENGGSSPCGSKNPAIAPGSSCSVSIQFNPLGNGTFTGRLIIESNDPTTEVTIVPLSGQG